MVALMPNLKAFAMSLCGNVQTAEDLSQTAFMKAWQHRDSFQSGTNLRAWMFTILRNTFITRVTHDKRNARLSEETYGKLAEMLPTPAAQEGHVDMLEYQEALKQLPHGQREAIVLIAAGFTYEEAAQLLNCPVGTIKSSASRARAALSKALGIKHFSEFGPAYNEVGNAGNRKGIR